MFVARCYFKFQYFSLLQISKCYKSKNISVLTSLLDIPHKKVKEFKIKHELTETDEEQIQNVIEFCESVNISKEEIKKNGKILKIKVRMLDSQYTSLKEIGFTKIDATILNKYRTCMNRSISILKMHELIPKDTNVAINLATHLKPKPSDFKTDDFSDDDLLGVIHKKLLIRYLMWKLSASEEQIEKLLRQTKSSIKSFRYLCESFALAKDLGISEEYTLQHGHILSSYPKYVLTTITEIPTICGVKTTEIYQRFPKLLSVAPGNMLEIKEILESRNISRETLLNSLSIFMLSPTTIRLRFEELESVPELKVLENNPRLLNLITQHNRARSRLSFLQNIKLQCASFGILGSVHNVFDAHIKQGIDENSLDDLRRLLETLLKKDYTYFDKNLRKHPFYLKVPLPQIQETFKYLKQTKYDTTSIANTIQILLYPKDKIKNAFELINQEDHLKTTPLTNEQKLNLALYFMERKHHFTGNGIWNNT